jgi:hypothetical protein
MLEAEQEPLPTRRKRLRLAITSASVWAFCWSWLSASPFSIACALKSSSVGAVVDSVDRAVADSIEAEVLVEVTVDCAVVLSWPRTGVRAEDRPRSSHTHLLRTAIVGNLRKVYDGEGRTKDEGV